MPYDMEWGSDRVVVRFSGNLTTAEFVEGARVIGADARFDELRFIVNDLRQARVDAVEVEQALEGLVESAAGGLVCNPGIRVAVISLQPRIAQLAQEFLCVMDSAGPVVAVFEEEAQALDWLHHPPGAGRLARRVDE